MDAFARYAKGAYLEIGTSDGVEKVQIAKLEWRNGIIRALGFVPDDDHSRPHYRRIELMSILGESDTDTIEDINILDWYDPELGCALVERAGKRAKRSRQ